MGVRGLSKGGWFLWLWVKGMHCRESRKGGSADSHVIEPHDLWSSRLTGRYREAAPKLVREDHTDRIVCAGMNLEFPVGLAAGVLRKDSEVRAEGRWDEDVPKSAYDPDERLGAMQEDGLVGEVLYPTLGLNMYTIQDQEILWAFLTAFNSWFGEFAGAHPDQLKGDRDAGAGRWLRRYCHRGVAAIQGGRRWRCYAALGS